MPDPVILFDEAAYTELLHDLCRGPRDTPEWFKLRMQAEEIALSPGFDQLLSLDLNNIDEYPHQIRRRADRPPADARESAPCR